MFSHYSTQPGSFWGENRFVFAEGGSHESEPNLGGIRQIGNPIEKSKLNTDAKKDAEVASKPVVEGAKAEKKGVAKTVHQKQKKTPTEQSKPDTDVDDDSVSQDEDDFQDEEDSDEGEKSEETNKLASKEAGLIKQEDKKITRTNLDKAKTKLEKELFANEEERTQYENGAKESIEKLSPNKLREFIEQHKEYDQGKFVEWNRDFCDLLAWKPSPEHELTDLERRKIVAAAQFSLGEHFNANRSADIFRLNPKIANAFTSIDGFMGAYTVSVLAAYYNEKNPGDQKGLVGYSALDPVFEKKRDNKKVYDDAIVYLKDQLVGKQTEPGSAEFAPSDSQVQSFVKTYPEFLANLGKEMKDRGVSLPIENSPGFSRFVALAMQRKSQEKMNYAIFKSLYLDSQGSAIREPVIENVSAVAALSALTLHEALRSRISQFDTGRFNTSNTLTDDLERADAVLRNHSKSDATLGRETLQPILEAAGGSKKVVETLIGQLASARPLESTTLTEIQSATAEKTFNKEIAPTFVSLKSKINEDTKRWIDLLAKYDGANASRIDAARLYDKQKFTAFSTQDEGVLDYAPLREFTQLPDQLKFREIKGAYKQYVDSNAAWKSVCDAFTKAKFESESTLVPDQAKAKAIQELSKKVEVASSDRLDKLKALEKSITVFAKREEEAVVAVEAQMKAELPRLVQRAHLPSDMDVDDLFLFPTATNQKIDIIQRFFSKGQFKQAEIPISEEAAGRFIDAYFWSRPAEPMGRENLESILRPDNRDKFFNEVFKGADEKTILEIVDSIFSLRTLLGFKDSVSALQRSIQNRVDQERGKPHPRPEPALPPSGPLIAQRGIRR